MTDFGLTPLEWAVLHAIQDLDSRGVYPSGDRVAVVAEDWPESAVRAARTRLIRDGLASIATPNDRPEVPEPDVTEDDPGPGGTEALGPGNYLLLDEAGKRKWLAALWRVVNGRVGLYRHLSVLTGVSPNALKCRANEATNSIPREELERSDDDDLELDAADRKYLAAMYRDSDDPAIREWMDRYAPARSAHPDRARFRSA